MKSKSLWVLLGLACVGCCALPLLGLFGVAALVPVFFWADALEVLLCLLPLLVIGVLLWRKSRQPCCEKPGQGCGGEQCERKG